MNQRLLLCSFSVLLLLVACGDHSDRAPGPPSLLTVRSTAAPEGPAGVMSELVFPVFMDGPQERAVVVRYQSRDLEARVDEDYLPVQGELTIPAGQVEGSIVVELLGDATEEVAERFELQLTLEGNAQLTADTAIGTIANDDGRCDSPFNKEPNPWILPTGSDPLNYAHRGGVIDFPENTLYAYYEVARAGADVLEMDVYQTADNELVILHDLDVDRTTDGSGNVVDLTLAELRALDAAYWFVPGRGTPHDAAEGDYVFRGIATGDRPPPPGYRASDFRIPTLEEALQAFPRELINIELKPDQDGVGDYERQIAELLLQYGRTSDLIAASFVDAAANNFKAVAPCIPTSVPLQEGVVLVLGSYGPDLSLPPIPNHVAFQIPRNGNQISQLPPSLHIEVATPDLVADAHAVNVAVQVWTINDCQDMLDMIALGVDAIMTDRPLLLEELLNTPPGERRCD